MIRPKSFDRFQISLPFEDMVDAHHAKIVAILGMIPLATRCLPRSIVMMDQQSHRPFFGKYM
ncbi:MAG: hypothetical protein DI547_11830 [Sphingobium sp.]|nr:MAG: hypothetical protein DI547_11830 [Sphingobium sp.]